MLPSQNVVSSGEQPSDSRQESNNGLVTGMGLNGADGASNHGDNAPREESPDINPYDIEMKHKWYAERAAQNARDNERFIAELMLPVQDCVFF